MFFGQSIHRVYAKFKKLKKALVVWSKKTYCYLVKKVETLEDIISVQECQLEMIPTQGNRKELTKVEVEFARY